MTDNVANAALPKELSGTVIVAGAGVSGRGMARLLERLGVEHVVADDDLDRAGALAAETGGRAVDTEAARGLLEGASLVATSPGWRPDTPLLAAAKAAGVEVVGDVELGWRVDRSGALGAPRTWLGITGTNGKTTATAMLEAMLIAGGKNAAAVGNIGTAVCDALAGDEPAEVLAVELSSFQLHWTSRLRLDGGGLLNLAEDHLDWHGGMAGYAADKAKILSADFSVVGPDRPALEAAERAGAALSATTTLGEPKPGQLGVADGALVDRTGSEPVALARVEGIDPPGPAGIADALVAAALARSQGVAAGAISAALAGFHSAAHRGQTVATANGVAWIDNSKATNPHAADGALAGHDRVVWLAGGQLKGAAVDDLVRRHAHRLKAAVLLGQDRRVIAEALERHAPGVPVVVVDDAEPEAAMAKATEAAAGLAQPGDVVLLAPAAASLDMFPGMARRGELFADGARASSRGRPPGAG
ncbi:UDP-N-acetylmuramoyl-L-alanine--D-glutamate ligase [Corynebacterium otitidis]